MLPAENPHGNAPSRTGRGAPPSPHRGYPFAKDPSVRSGLDRRAKTADIDGVTLRRISVKDLMEGILMLEDKVEGVELIRVDAAELTVTACVRAISSC